MIKILHLSDLHVTDYSEIDIRNFDYVFEACKNELLDAEEVLIILSGDLVFSGNSQQYETLKKYVIHLVERINGYCKIQTKVFSVPGNHDCNYEHPQSDPREVLLNSYNPEEKKVLTKSTIEFCNQVLDNFYNFNNEIDTDKPIIINDIVNVSSIKLKNGNKINIIKFNSAWGCLKDSKPASLPLPSEYYDIDPAFIDKSSFNIAVMHHPIEWLYREDARKLRSWFRGNIDILFTGHEHITDSYLLGVDEKETMKVVEAGILRQKENNWSNSTFNIITINYNDNSIIYNEYVRSGGGKYRRKKINNWQLGDKVPSFASSRLTILDPKWKDKLFTTNMELVRAAEGKDNYLVEEIFVYPMLSATLTSVTKNDKSGHVKSQKLVDNCSIKSYQAIIVGESQSGKTTLLKKYYIDLLAKGLRPIMLNAEDLISNSPSIQDIIKNSCIKQYNDVQEQDMGDLDYQEVVLLIDNYDDIHDNPKWQELYEQIKSYEMPIIMTVQEEFQFNNIVSATSGDIDPLKEYEWFKIEYYGHMLREKIVKKWLILQSGGAIKYEAKEVGKKMRVLRELIGRNYIPSYPIFIYTILSAGDFSPGADIQKSAYVHYYNHLVVRAMVNAGIKPEDLDGVMKYLSEMAYKIFKDGQSMTRKDFGQFQINYIDEYDISASIIEDIEALLHALVKSRIISRIDDEISFNYKYAFYYFVAKYIAEDMPNSKQEIVSLINDLDSDISASILMFVTHHSKDPFILQSIETEIQDIFNGTSEICFEEDVKIISDLVSEIPQQVYYDDDTDQIRYKHMRNQDKLEEEELGGELQEISEKQVYDVVLQLRRAFRAIGIAGQVLKNYSGSMKADKRIELGKITYSLCMRAIKRVYELFESEREILLGLIINELKRQYDVEEYKIKEMASQLVFYIYSRIAYAYIKRLSMAIAHEKLDKTIDQIEKLFQNTAGRLVDIAVRLEYQKGSAVEKVKQASEKLKDNNLATFLLRRFVIDYLYMFGIPVREQQSLCEEMDIQIGDMRRIQETSHTRKDK